MSLETTEYFFVYFGRLSLYSLDFRQCKQFGTGFQLDTCFHNQQLLLLTGSVQPRLHRWCCASDEALFVSSRFSSNETENCAIFLQVCL